MWGIQRKIVDYSNTKRKSQNQAEGGVMGMETTYYPQRTNNKSTDDFVEENNHGTNNGNENNGMKSSQFRKLEFYPQWKYGYTQGKIQIYLDKQK